MPKPRIAVFKFASCDGCQLTLLDCEDELLAVLGEVELCEFAEASSRFLPGPYDLALIDGSVSTPEDALRIRRLRAETRVLVTLGACATAGGVQALRNLVDADALKRLVYARPEYVASLATSTPISAHVKVDLELHGCPIDKGQLLEVITAFLHGRRPALPSHALCEDCRMSGVMCVTVAHGTPCMGPVTRTGCGVLCPRHDRGCYGCFGPMESPNLDALVRLWRGLGVPEREIVRALRHVQNGAPAFAEAAARLEAP
jgi:coenzyme F420-reducing hydrogenase gamma subunit